MFLSESGLILEYHIKAKHQAHANHWFKSKNQLILEDLSLQFYRSKFHTPMQGSEQTFKSYKALPLKGVTCLDILITIKWYIDFVK